MMKSMMYCAFFILSFPSHLYCSEPIHSLGRLQQQLQELSGLIKASATEGSSFSENPKEGVVTQKILTIEEQEEQIEDRIKSLKNLKKEAIKKLFPNKEALIDDLLKNAQVNFIDDDSRKEFYKIGAGHVPEFPGARGQKWNKLNDLYKKIEWDLAAARSALAEVAEEPKKIEASAFEIPRSLFKKGYPIAINEEQLDKLEPLKKLYDFAFNFLFAKLPKKKEIMRPYGFSAFDDSDLINDAKFMSRIRSAIEETQREFITPADVTAAIDRIVTALFYREYEYSGSWGRLAQLPTDQFKEQDKKIWDEFIAAFVEKAKDLGWKLVFKIPKEAVKSFGSVRKTLYFNKLSNELQSLFKFAVELLYRTFVGNPKREKLSDQAHIEQEIMPQYLGSLLQKIYIGTYPQYSSESAIFALFVLEDQNQDSWKKGVDVENDYLKAKMPKYKDYWNDDFMKQFISKAQALKLIE